MNNTNFPCKCPTCSRGLKVTHLVCDNCQTIVSGHFDIPPLGRLVGDDKLFLEAFLMARGSIKETGARLGISYPTVKARLETVLAGIAAEAGPCPEGHGKEKTIRINFSMESATPLPAGFFIPLEWPDMAEAVIEQKIAPRLREKGRELDMAAIKNALGAGAPGSIVEMSGDGLKLSISIE